jgi:biotin transport system substrate-specific component
MQTQAATLRLAVLPRASALTDVVLVAAGAGLVALCAQASFHLGYTPVPITLQTFPVLLIGAALGPIRGAASLLLYLLLGIAGVPVYAGHRHGWAVFSGATGGYIVGFVVAAMLIGWLAERRWDRKFSSAVGSMLTGTVVIYLCGALWLRHDLHLNWASTLEDGVYPFIPLDLAKLYLAAAALPGAWRLVDRLKGPEV